MQRSEARKLGDDVYLPIPATLTEVYSVTRLERFFRFEMDQGHKLDYLPGQFLEISVPGIGEAPISITSEPSDWSGAAFEVVVREAGNVTRALHRLERGAKVGVRGPYGTSFPVDGEMRERDLLFVCGGLGLVPVRSVITYVLRHRKDYGHVTILIGMRTPQDRLFVDEVLAWKQKDDVTVMETVDVGDTVWGGSVGVITKLIRRAPINPEKTFVVTCGPPTMYKFVIMELEQARVPKESVFLSLERRMKCGVGKCGHCQINGVYACRDGPVFRYSDIAGLPEAL